MDARCFVNIFFCSRGLISSSLRKVNVSSRLRSANPTGNTTSSNKGFGCTIRSKCIRIQLTLKVNDDFVCCQNFRFSF